MRQMDMRNAMEIVLGSTSVVALKAEGGMTCFVHLLFTDNRQGRDKHMEIVFKGWFG